MNLIVARITWKSHDLVSSLEFWENWYVLGENSPDSNDEFKFIYYNGKTRQNTYEGAFVYSRSKELSPESMKQVYEIAKGADMNVDQFCRIRNGCFLDSEKGSVGTASDPFRGFIASTKISELLGVEPVAAQDTIRRNTPSAKELTPSTGASRAWWYEVGDYLENPHRHFETMDSLRVPVEWPEEVSR